VSGADSRLREAAVLVPIHRDADGDLRVVLIRRADRGAHAGQIAFPGGRREPGDADALATALREAHEEIGLEPHDVRVIEALPAVTTRSTGYTIAPFLVEIRRPDRWRPDPAEVAEVLDVKLADLERVEARGESLEQFSGWAEPRRVPFVWIGAHRLWGATHRILIPLIPRLRAGEWTLT
jgi:8-oxo-dGTP pyrophosphatase MutT (NUDIX family)